MELSYTIISQLYKNIYATLCLYRRQITYVFSFLILIINGRLFTTGYWLTADDVMFLQFGIEGWDTVFESASLIAVHSGRIGQNLQVPLNVLGALWSDVPIFRVAYVAAYFFVIYLYGRWFDIISGKDIAYLTFFLGTALTPLHFFHLPPTSFPLQNTVPFLLIIGLRIRVLTRGTGKSFFCRYIEPYITALLYAFILLISEYAILLGISLVAIEYTLKIYQNLREYRIASIVVTRAFLLDMVSCIFPILVYVAWRLIYPSSYDGNSLNGFERPALALITWFKHTFSLSYIAVTQPEAWQYFGLLNFVMAAFIGGFVFLSVLWSASDRAKATSKIVLLLILCCFALFITAPVSLTEKQQTWCDAQNACVFLDSRVASLAVTSIEIILIGIVFQWAGRLRIFGLMIKLVVSVFVGFIAIATFQHNVWMSKVMGERMAVWDDANKLICESSGLKVFDRSQLDPDQRIEVHPHLNPDRFWKIYSEYRRLECS